MEHLNILTKEADKDSDMNIYTIEDSGLMHIECEHEGVYDREYTRVLIDKKDAKLIIEHLKKQFDL